MSTTANRNHVGKHEKEIIIFFSNIFIKRQSIVHTVAKAGVSLAGNVASVASPTTKQLKSLEIFLYPAVVEIRHMSAAYPVLASALVSMRKEAGLQEPRACRSHPSSGSVECPPP